jgi:hypothetical protein
MHPVPEIPLARQTAAPDRTANSGARTRRQLNLALAYEDLITREWAQPVLDLVIEVAGEDAVRCTDWKIGDLREPRVYTGGAAAVARADVIVIAVHEAERFPAEFYVWTNLWLLMRSHAPGALVALVGGSGEAGPAHYETRSYFHALATQGGLDLFFKQCDPTCGKPGASWEKLTQWADSVL